MHFSQLLLNGQNPKRGLSSGNREQSVLCVTAKATHAGIHNRQSTLNGLICKRILHVQIFSTILSNISWGQKGRGYHHTLPARYNMHCSAPKDHLVPALGYFCGMVIAPAKNEASWRCGPSDFYYSHFLYSNFEIKFKVVLKFLNIFIYYLFIY